MLPIVKLTVESSSNALIAKAVELFSNRWKDRTQVRLLSRNNASRPAWELVVGTIEKPEMKAAIQAAGLALPEKTESYAITSKGRTLTVCGADGRGVLYGLGHLLRNLAFEAKSIAMPDLHETRSPDASTRGVLFTNHFNNFYEAAPDAEVDRYIEEMALWGYNLMMYAFDCNWFPHGFWKDPKSRGMGMIRQIHRMGKTARACGMKVATSGVANEGFFRQPPPELLADPRGRQGGFYLYSQICPSKPGGMEMILEVRRKVLELIGPIDMYWHWPYDQGACGCDQCTHAPGRWGRKFLEIGPAITDLVRAANPDVQVLVATWLMDETERKMVYDLCDQGAKWFQGLLTAVEHARERKIDPRYEWVTFPEISMFDCYFSSYGCNGANPAPKRFAAEASRVAQVGCGAILYSEGCYDDVNKVVYAGLLWDSNRDVGEILTEYTRYYFGGKNVKAATALIRGLETTWGAEALLKAGRKTVAALAKSSNDLKKRLPRHSDARDRWRMLDDRARMDQLMKEAPSWKKLVIETRGLLNDAEYISTRDLRSWLRSLLAKLKARQRQADQLFQVHWEYMRYFHFQRNIMVYLPDAVMGKYNFETLIEPLSKAASQRNDDQLRDGVMHALKRWFWFNGIDSNYVFVTADPE